MQRKFHKSEGKLKRVVGIGGIKCSCCTLGPKPVTKKFWNRIQRHSHNKKELAEILRFEEEEFILDMADYLAWFDCEEIN